MTGNKIIVRSLTRLGIRASETSLQADEVQDGLDLLNDMLSEWERLYHLGFSPIENITDEVRVPRNANGAIIDHLAIRMAPEYSRPISSALATSARLSLNNLLNANVFIGDVDYPSTLPKGSGNECPDLDDHTRFFPEKDKGNF